YHRSAPYAASTSPSTERSATALMAGLPHTDYLKGATVGVLLDDLPGANKTYDQIIAPRLKALGVVPKDVYRVNGTDASAQSSQAAGAVLQFRTEGINHVIFFAG